MSLDLPIYLDLTVPPRHYYEQYLTTRQSVLFPIFSCSALERTERKQLVVAMFSTLGSRQEEVSKISVVFGPLLSFFPSAFCFCFVFKV